jgi:hypothetical protein
MTKDVPNAIRISLGAPSSMHELESALRKLREEPERAATAAV